MKRYLIFVLLFSAISVFGQDSLNIKQTAFKRLLIGINFSPDFCYRTLKGEDELSAKIADLNNKSEKPKFGYSSGINFCYNISSHLGFEGGFQYSNKGYGSKLNASDLTFGDEIDPRYGFVYPTQPFEPGLKKIIFHYNWIYFDVPIRAIYNFGKRRIHFLASIGITTNILLKSTTTVIHKYENGDTKRITQKQIDKYKTLNLSPSLSIGANYKINKKMNLRIEPTFRYGVLTIIDAPIKGYLWNTGFNVTCYYAIK